VRDPKGGLHKRTYVMNVGMDLRLVDTKVSYVVDVISYQKKIVGREVSAGLFSFLGGEVIDMSTGNGGLESIQLAVRSEIERWAPEIISRPWRTGAAYLSAGHK
jgi:curli production assembly/transport component CsgG/holdfast attachment protein HfaB